MWRSQDKNKAAVAEEKDEKRKNWIRKNGNGWTYVI